MKSNLFIICLIIVSLYSCNNKIKESNLEIYYSDKLIKTKEFEIYKDTGRGTTYLHIDNNLKNELENVIIDSMLLKTKHFNYLIKPFRLSYSNREVFSDYMFSVNDSTRYLYFKKCLNKDLILLISDNKKIEKIEYPVVKFNTK